MGGENPYLKQPSAEKPKQKYTLSFTSGEKIVVDPTDLPTSGTGRPGSVLDIALASGIDIEHACGGVLACSTCHVFVNSGATSCSPASEEEEDQLEEAPGITSRSRLACQCVPDGSSDVVVEIPSWRKNQVREGKGS